MEVINFAEKNSVINRFMAELRDVNIQTDRIRFRRNLERIGEIMAYEISHRLHYSEKKVKTPLGTAHVNLPDDTVVLATILRAGLPFHQGFLSCLDDAENAFVSAYRKYKDKLNFDIFIEYIASQIPCWRQADLWSYPTKPCSPKAHPKTYTSHR